MFGTSVAAGCSSRIVSDDAAQKPDRPSVNTEQDCSMVNREPDRGLTTATPLNVDYRVGRISKYLSGHWLDFGCADGGYDQEMLNRGLAAISGVDVERPRIAEARKRNLPNSFYTAFDGRTLPFGDCYFDGTLMNEVFEHVADEQRALSETFRVLKPGGTLVLISPNRWFPIEGHNVTIGPKTICPAPLIPWLPEPMTRNWTAARNYWPSQLRRHVKDAGFAILETSFIWPVLEVYPWLPASGIALYQKYFRTLDHLPGLRRFGVSTMVVGVKPAYDRTSGVPRLPSGLENPRPAVKADIL